MKLILHPQRRDDGLVLSRIGSILTINGQALDLTPLPNGATLPKDAVDCDWLAGDIVRDELGVLHIPLLFPHGPIPWPAPEGSAAVTHPSPVISMEDGPIALPHWAPPETEPEGSE